MRVTTITCDHCGYDENPASLPGCDPTISPVAVDVSTTFGARPEPSRGGDLCDECRSKLGPYIDAFFVPPPKTRRADPGITT